MNISDILFAIALGSCGLIIFVVLLYVGINLIKNFDTNDKIFGIVICVFGIVVMLFIVAIIFSIVEAKTAVQMIEGGA